MVGDPHRPLLPSLPTDGGGEGTLEPGTTGYGLQSPRVFWVGNPKEDRWVRQEVLFDCRI